MAMVAEIDNSRTILHKGLAIRSGIVLALVILGFVTHDITHIPTYLIAMIGASVLMIFEKPSSERMSITNLHNSGSSQPTEFFLYAKMIVPLSTPFKNQSITTVTL